VDAGPDPLEPPTLLPPDPAAAGAPTQVAVASVDIAPIMRPVALRPMRTGTYGSDVRDLQRELRRRGQRITVDGAYGPATKAAVKRLQKRMRLPATGVASTTFLRRLGLRARVVASAPPPGPVGAIATIDAPKKAGLLQVFPVQGEYRYSDDYGDPRGGGRSHQGNDILADKGTPIVAVADGTILRMDRVERGLGGVSLWLEDTDGNTFYYAHLTSISEELSEGSKVTVGQVIATMGNTGDARYGAPHLHFEVHPGGGGAVNPYRLLQAIDPRATS
jgi:murein DD-endopeptidase MepM/ murein hydrolase activator NlpD